MTQTLHIAVLAGDGIGPEITREAVAVLERLSAQGHFGLSLEAAEVGGAGYRASGHPLPDATLKLAQQSQAVLFGAVGDFSLDTLPRELRPEQAILGLRKSLGLFANLRPAMILSAFCRVRPMSSSPCMRQCLRKVSTSKDRAKTVPSAA